MRSISRDTAAGIDRDMRVVALSFILGLMLVIHGCSSESAKRTAFETLQNLREQQCDQDLSGHCPKREGYADDQRKRKATQYSQ